MSNVFETYDGLGRASFLTRYLVIAPNNGAYFDKLRQ